jgi:general secretion pathway protein L
MTTPWFHAFKIFSLSRWQSSPLPEFLRWWRDELLDMLPTRWRQTLAPTRQRQRIYWPDDLPGTASDSPDIERILMLTADQVLICPLQLPLAAARDLPAVLSFEMDKYVPFSADQVYFAAKRLKRGKEENLGLLLAVIPRQRLEALLDNKPRFDAVDVVDAQGQALGINLAPAHLLRTRRHTRRTLDRVLTLIAIGLILTAMQLWLHNRESVVQTMQARVKTLQQQVQQMQALSTQLDGLQQVNRYVQARKEKTPGLGAVLSDLSYCIPNTTWVAQLDINAEGQVSLNGESSQASELINSLKHCTQVVNPQFQGTIQTDPTTGKERFLLQVSLRTREPEHAPAQTP